MYVTKQIWFELFSPINVSKYQGGFPGYWFMCVCVCVRACVRVHVRGNGANKTFFFMHASKASIQHCIILLDLCGLKRKENTIARIHFSRQYTETQTVHCANKTTFTISTGITWVYYLNGKTLSLANMVTDPTTYSIPSSWRKAQANYNTRRKQNNDIIPTLLKIMNNYQWDRPI